MKCMQVSRVSQNKKSKIEPKDMQLPPNTPLTVQGPSELFGTSALNSMSSGSVKNNNSRIHGTSQPKQAGQTNDSTYSKTLREAREKANKLKPTPLNPKKTKSAPLTRTYAQAALTRQILEKEGKIPSLLRQNAQRDLNKLIQATKNTSAEGK